MIGPLNGFWWMMVLQLINLALLFFGFRGINRGKQRRRRTVTLALLTLILLTLPALWLVILLPAFVAS